MNALRQTTVAACLIDRAARSPLSIAFRRRSTDGWIGESWSDVFSRVRNLSAWLTNLGLARGDRVAIMMPTSIEWELCHLAALAAGCTVVGLDAHDAPANIGHILDVVQPRALFVSNSQQAEDLSALLTNRPDIRVIREPSTSPDCYSLGDLLTAAMDPPANWPLARPQDNATIIFTSGTTGQPKGIAYTHEQLCLACEAILERFPDVGEGARFACWLPLSNLFQRVINLCGMIRGGESYFVETPADIIRRLPEIRPTLFIGVPRFYEKLLDGIETNLAQRPAWIRLGVHWARNLGSRYRHKERSGHRPTIGLTIAYWMADRLILKRIRALMGPDLQFMISGSAPLPVWLLERFHAIGLLILEAYGTSENVVPIGINSPQAFRFGSVGRPLPQNSIQLATDGELLVSGPGVCRGYLPESGQASPVDSEGFLHTGDYARLDADSYLWLTGRKSEIFKTSTGRRVAPVPIETRIRQLPYVDHCVAIGRGRPVPAVLASISRDRLPGAGGSTSLLSAESLDHIADDMAEACSELPPFDRPAAVLVTARAFTITGGELTANLKLRRAAIEETFSREIDELYSALAKRLVGEGILVKEAS